LDSDARQFFRSAVVEYDEVKHSTHYRVVAQQGDALWLLANVGVNMNPMLSRFNLEFCWTLDGHPISGLVEEHETEG